MKRLNISPDLKLPVEAITQTFAVLAMRGAGKTYTASVFAEELCAALLPFAVLDPTGAWYGLRSSADGKSEGYPVTILGGDHADAPLEETAGKVVADLLAEEAPPLILDMSRLSKSAMRRFVADFAERLYEKNRNPLHLIIDEADAFVPQKPRPDDMRMLGAIDEIVRRGRIRGLGCTLVTQRSAVLNKDVLTQAEVLVVLRTAHPRDRAPVLEWMKVHATDEQMAAVEESLAKLPKGDAWVMSAGWLDLFKRINVRERRTFNSSATPEIGHRRITPRRFASVDLAALQKRMAATIEKAKADDPKLLRAEIARLQREVKVWADAPAPVAKSAKTKTVRLTVDRPVIVTAQISRIEKALRMFDDRAADLYARLDGLDGEVLRPLLAELGRLKHIAVDKPGRHIEERADPIDWRPRKMAALHIPVHLDPARPTKAIRIETTNGKGFPAGARRMLEQLAIWHPRPLARGELSVLSGVSMAGGSFSTYLSKLRMADLVGDTPSGEILITGPGRVVVGEVSRPQSTEEIVAMFGRKLTAGARRMLDLLVEAHPHGLHRVELSERSGVSTAGGSFSTYLSKLRTAGLLREEGGTIFAAEVLFTGV